MAEHNGHAYFNPKQVTRAFRDGALPYDVAFKMLIFNCGLKGAEAYSRLKMAKRAGKPNKGRTKAAIRNGER